MDSKKRATTPSTTVAAPHVDRRTFLMHLRQSGLLTKRQLAAAEEFRPDSPRGRVLARALVERGWITRFQAERLLAGFTSGFVLGQYRIEDQIGRGGMGQVFQAVHVTMNRTVALKVLAPHLVNTTKARRLFLREVQAAARLVHPNIVTAFDANQVGNRHYLVMEYVDGPNLDRLVRDHGPLPVGQACDFIRQAAQGLQHAFEAGMVHRDIKPANLLVHRPGGPGSRCVVKILDFGLARLGEPGPVENAGAGTIVTRLNVLVGTPDFVSPEQARNLHAADIRSDLYSLGCTFFYLLTGQAPFAGGTTLEKVIRHSTEEPPALAQFRADVPPAVEAILRRLLAKDPAARYQTPADLATDLAPFAVEASEPWTIPGPVPNSAALPATPLPGDTGVVTNAGTGSEALAALYSTLPADLAATPMSPSRLPATGTTDLPTRPSLPWTLRLLIALGVGIAAGLALAALAALLR